MSSKALLRRLLLQPLRRRPARVRGAALRVEAMEDRITPAVTAVVPPATSDLQVNLSAAGDTAVLNLNGANIEVR
ncbi:MAG TPA: hypothetical protein VH092_02145, partial [Urbifossiella sp.]|nr:hypothetical protein [Urbifossiella sp.]